MRQQSENPADSGPVRTDTWAVADDTSQRQNPPRRMFRSLAGEPDPLGSPAPTGGREGWTRSESPLSHFASERELADRVLERLEPWFHIEREVAGTSCSGRRLRVDAMLRPRDVTPWRNPDVAFGVEFKLPVPDAPINVYTRWLAQAVDYTHVEWDGYGRRLILTCPGVTSYLSNYRVTGDSRASEVYMIKRIAGQFGVGELVLEWGSGLTMLLNAERIWSERRGVRKGKHWDLNPREGSR